MEGIIGDNTMETKSIVYEQPEKGLQFPLMLTAFDGEDHPVFDKAGYRGRYVLFTLIDGGVQDSFTDPFKAEHPQANDELRNFFVEVRQGWRTEGRHGINWTELEDGEEYNKKDFGDFDL